MSQEVADAMHTDEVSVAARSRKLHRRLSLIAIGVLLVLLLVVLPPLLKLNRYARRIAFSMSQSLGRPVHLDSVSLGLLPMPHLTLENVVVSEDPAFGNEPTIRANRVEASLRASSLWRRPMEFSRVLFVEPSVNLVRNADGRWNLEGVLVHAAQVDTAPTAQQHRSTAPRFPYIEATGGRVNVKMGDEKKPFSLTNADFALWLPSPEQWSVRLTGTPARTDTNLTDAGVIRVEGSLQRAAHMEQVPVALQASWHDVPLGEATRLLSGEDQGWRGTVQVDASIKGSLGAGRVATEVTVDDLRRADFVPAHTLSMQLQCVALAQVPMASLRDLACNLPTGSTAPLRLQAEAVDLTQPLAAGITFQAEAAPLEWFASWARLVSARFPQAPVLPGTVDASLSRTSADAATAASPLANAVSPVATTNIPTGWLGNISLNLPLPAGTRLAGAFSETNPASRVAATSPRSPPSSSPETTVGRSQTITADLTAGSAGGAWRLTLPPTQVQISDDSALSFSGTATPAGYSLRAAGQANLEKLLRLAEQVPPLADHLASAFGPAVATGAVHLDVTCARGWMGVTGDQTCTRALEPTRKPVRLRR